MPKIYLKLTLKLHPELDERDCQAVQAMLHLVFSWREKKILSEICYNKYSLRKTPARFEVYLKRHFQKRILASAIRRETIIKC